VAISPKVASKQAASDDDSMRNALRRNQRKASMAADAAKRGLDSKRRGTAAPAPSQRSTSRRATSAPVRGVAQKAKGPDTSKVEWTQTGNDETYQHAWQRIMDACVAQERGENNAKKGTNVVVAVRLRPFNKRENFLESKSVVECEQNTVRLINSATKADGGKEQSFNFDYVFNSFDSGSSSFANQQVVFETVGIDLLVNAWCGFNVSIFAYGQTGSGKSYSMQGAGSGSDLGIIPRLCEYLFYVIDRKNQETKDDDGLISGGPVQQLELQVDASYLEVYNEKIFDLLASPDHDANPKLKIREHPKTGVYVEGLTLEPVDCYNDLSQLMNDGMQNRTIAGRCHTSHAYPSHAYPFLPCTTATNMNATSSRSHCIFTLHFTQRRSELSAAAADGGITGEPEVVCKVSKINLVDLAGSEDSRRTGAEGVRLQEGGNINKSLLTLGQCIKSLSENSARGSQGELAPSATFDPEIHTLTDLYLPLSTLGSRFTSPRPL
jgi:hypothetical protein